MRGQFSLNSEYSVQWKVNFLEILNILFSGRSIFLKFQWEVNFLEILNISHAALNLFKILNISCGRVNFFRNLNTSYEIIFNFF